MAEELTQHSQICGKIAALSERLLTNHPQMPLLLQEIHRTLKEDPAIMTLLSEEEVCTIVNGLEKQTNTYIIQSMTSAKSASAKTKALKNVKSSDLGFDD